MGMSSSQARLLSLTARMHDIEYKAQRLEAQKLQLANESSRAYEDYLRVLDAKKLQYKTILNDGTITFQDATCNILQNGVIPNYAGEHARDILFLQNQNGKVMITEEVANHYRLTATTIDPDLDHYIPTVVPGATQTKEVMRPELQYIPGTVGSFTIYSNGTEVDPVNIISHSGYDNYVKNVEDGKFDVTELTGYAQFNDSHTTVSATEITEATTSISSGDYIIKTAKGLKKFMELTQASGGTSANITIMADIDMSTVDMSDWKGIKGYSGEFNGNGYTISNITGSNGLFESTSAAKIQNVAVTVGTAGINGGSYVGALIGNANDTDVINCCATEGKVTGSSEVGGLIGKFNSPGGSDSIIRNVYSTCDVSGTSQLGGLIGHYNVSYVHSDPRSNPTFENTFATGDVSGDSEIGGLVGYFYSDPDKGVSGGSNSYNTDVKNCFSGGKLTGNSSVGGFVGKLSCYDDYEDHFRFIKIDTCAKIVNTGVTSAGIFVGTNAAVTATTVSDFQTSSFGQGINPVLEGESPKRLVGEVPSGSASINPSSVSAMSVAGRIPDVTDAYISNIEAVLIKAEKYDPCHPDAPASVRSDMRANITAFLNKFSDNTADNTKLWFLNEAIGEYLTDSGSADLGDKLYQDIMNTTTSNTASFQTGSMVGNVKRGGGDFWDVTGSHTVTNGKIDIPSVKTIADELWGLMKKNDNSITITASDVETWMATNYPTTSAPYASQTAEERQTRISLANISDRLNNGGDLSALTSAILIGGSKVDYSDKWADGYKGGNWEVNIGADQTVHYTEAQDYVDVLDHKEWDTSIPEIANAIAMWYLGQKGIEIIHEPEASNYEYLENMLVAGEVVLTEFDPNGAVALQGMPAADILALTEEEFHKIMGIKNTNVAIRTSVKEVQDEKELRKAEAKYEADMKKIDLKDRRYDSELAAVDTERNAIKQEIDTLKNVAKDNCERTFKLFS